MSKRLQVWQAPAATVHAAQAAKRTHSVYRQRDPVIANFQRFNPTGPVMSLVLRVLFGALLAAASVFTSMPGYAQSGESKGGDKPSPAPAADAAKEAQRRIDEFAEASRLVNGPAGNPECVWLGRRVVGLLWRDDMDTAFRHLDLYDRFGCPGPHIQAAFRCVVRQGSIDPKSPQSLNARVHDCWLNPGTPPAAAAAATPPAAPPPAAKTTGTTGK
jgi:hypothetical protein